MSAIDIHVGTQAPEDRDTTLVCDVDGEPLGDGHEMDGARACLPSLESTHNGLTRTVWIRRTIEELLVGRNVYVTDGASLGKDAPALRTALFFVIDPPFHKYDIPWMPAALDEIRTVELIGESGKMACVARGTMIPVRGRGLLPIEDVVASVSAGDVLHVQTRAGWKRVLDARQTGRRRTVVVRTKAGYSVRVTPDHLVASRDASRRSEPSID